MARWRSSNATKLGALAAVVSLNNIWTEASSPQKPLAGRSSPFTKNFGDFVSETLDKWHVPGVAIAVIDGEDTWTEGYGIATFPATPMTADTLFYTGSTTKAFVAVALSLMIESNDFIIPSPQGARSQQEHLTWTTPISAILRDDFVLMDPWATDHLTIEDALSHRTGMPRHDKAFARTYDDHPATIKDLVRSLRYLPLNAEPRTMYQYCNLMFTVLSHVIETLTQRWLGNVLREWIWEPLGMNSTYFDIDDALNAPEHFAAGYYWHNSTEEFISVPYMPLEEVSGAGAIVSSVNDYAKWVRALIYETAPLSKTGLAQIKTPKITTTAETGSFDTPPAYASAWITTSYKGHRFWTHSGGVHAYGTEAFFFPDKKYGVVTFGNTAITSNDVGLILAWHLIDEKLGIAKDQRVNWSDRLEKGIRAKGAKIESAIDDVFPDRARPPLSPQLPLRYYTGTYFHPGYRNLTLELVDSGEGKKNKTMLVAERKDFTWPMICEFEHVSGEYWMIYFDMLYERSGNFREYSAARFTIGPDGKVESLVVDFLDLSTGAVEGVITFNKVG